MAVRNLRRNVAYGLSDPLLNVFPQPIVQKRSPTPNDFAQIGQMWIDTSNDTVYVLTHVANNFATWTVAAQGGGGVNQINTDSGVVLPAANVVSILGGTNINTSGATSVVTINLDDSIVLTGSITAATGLRITSFGAGVVQTNATGVFASTNGTDGQILIADTGGVPAWANITAGTNIVITNGANSITIDATGSSSTVNYTAVNTDPYVVADDDYFLGVDVTGGPITIELPDAPATGRIIVIKDSMGLSSTNTITVTTVSTVVTIDGSTSQDIDSDYGSLQVLFDGTTYQIF